MNSLCLCLMFLALPDSREVILPTGLQKGEEMGSLEWNRYSSGNFTIYSIDDSQGRWLKANAERIRTGCVEKWGFPQFSFSRECRIFCVPSARLLKKLFDLEESRVEYRKNLTVVWMSLEGNPELTVRECISRVTLRELEGANQVKIGWWFKRGASLLSGSTEEIKKSLSFPSAKYSAKDILEMAEDRYIALPETDRRAFDRQSLFMCLFLRREFGEVKMQGFMRLSSKNDPEDVVRLVYGFGDYVHFGKQFSRYVKDLSGDVISGKTPDTYLVVKSGY